MKVQIIQSFRFWGLFSRSPIPPTRAYRPWTPLILDPPMKKVSGRFQMRGCLMYMVAQKHGAILSHCKYSENAMTELRGNR